MMHHRPIDTTSTPSDPEEKRINPVVFPHGKANCKGR
jgi:hypothetical protein